jgi:hypothetical protein
VRHLFPLLFDGFARFLQEAQVQFLEEFTIRWGSQSCLAFVFAYLSAAFGFALAAG